MDPAVQESLHTACSIGDESLVSAILSMGFNSIDLEHKTRNNTPLLVACWEGRANIVDMLIQAGSDVDAEDHEQFSCLHAAAFKGFVPIIALLLDKGANIEARDDARSTPFAIATLNGHFKAMRLLAKRGADVSPLADDNVSPLGMACCTGSESRVRVLLQLGADPKARVTVTVGPRTGLPHPKNAVFSNVGESCLLQVILYLWPSSPVLAPGESDDDARAAGEDQARRYLSIAEMLIAAGADLGLRHMSDTAVHIAAGIDNRRLMTALLRAGASTSATSVASNGVIGTALSRAALYSRPLATRLLLHAGALETERDGEGFRPIHVVGSLARDLPPAPQKELESRRVAVTQALLRGPAFRATVWLWPAVGLVTKVPSSAATAAAATEGPAQKAAGEGGTKGKGAEKKIPSLVTAAAMESKALATATAKVAAALEREGGAAMTKEETDEEVPALTDGVAAACADYFVCGRFVAQPRYGECGRKISARRLPLSAMWRWVKCKICFKIGFRFSVKAACVCVCGFAGVYVCMRFPVVLVWFVPPCRCRCQPLTACIYSKASQ